jgi:drug/metabolite transporter (DMT)-like permease
MSTTAPTRPALSAILGLLAGAIMISFAAVFVRLSDMPPTTSGFYRMVFGLAAWWVLLIAVPAMRQGWQQAWPSSILIAAFFCADIWFWHQSIAFIGPGLSTLLANFQVFILTAVGVVLFKEHIHWRFGLGLGLAMAGLWLLFGREWAELGLQAQSGVWLGLLTACAYALYLLSLRGFQIKHPSIRPERPQLCDSLQPIVAGAGGPWVVLSGARLAVDHQKLAAAPCGVGGFVVADPAGRVGGLGCVVFLVGVVDRQSHRRAVGVGGDLFWSPREQRF